MSRSRLLVFLAYAGMCLVWGSTWSVIKIGLEGAPPLTSIALRFLLAGALVVTAAGAARLAVPRTRAFLLLSLLLGVCHQAAGYVLVYYGEQRISSGLTAVLFSTMPFAVAVLARIFLGDAITPRKIVGIAIGMLGVLVIFADSVRGGNNSIAGIFLVLGSVLFASFSSVMVKKHAATYHPLVMLLYPVLIGGVIVTALAVPIEHANPLSFDTRTWMTIVYLAGFGSVVAFTLFFYVVKRVPVVAVAYQTFVIPIVALVIGRIFLDEALSWHLAAGTAFILTGILVTAWRRRAATLPPLVERIGSGRENRR